MAEDAPLYEVVVSELASADLDSIFHWILPRNPNGAELIRSGILRSIHSLPEFPGPRSHAKEEEASAHFGFEVRRMLYRGSGRVRVQIPYRILFTLVEDPENAGRPTIIRVLRVLHGSQLLAPPADEE